MSLPGMFVLSLVMQLTLPARPGDTWKSLALRIYGDTAYTETLRNANPGLNPPRGAIHVPEIPAFAEVLLVVGRATRRHGIPLQPGARLQEKDTLYLEAQSRVELLLSDGSRLRLDGPSRVAIRKLRRVDPFDLRAWFHVLRGQIELRLRRLTGLTKNVEISTPSAKGSIRGTWTALRTDSLTTWNMVFTGNVQLTNPSGQVLVKDGQGTVAHRSQPPLPPQPLPPPPRIRPIPSRVLLAGRSTAPLRLSWRIQNPLNKLHLMITHSDSLWTDTLLPPQGQITLRVPPGSLSMEWRTRDTLGLESVPLRYHVSVVLLH